MKYKSSYRAAVPDLFLHAALFAGSLYGTKFSWAFVVPLALMQIRTFVVFHDCTHGSYTPNEGLNTTLAHILGVFVFTPQLWGQRHSIHHKTNGNPENEYHFKFNEVVLHTTEDVRRMGDVKLLIFRMLHCPFFLYPAVAVFDFLLNHRIFHMLFKAIKGKRYPLSWPRVLSVTAAHNFALALFIHWLRQEGLLYKYLLSMLLFATAAFCIFHTQHTFNPAYISNNETWRQQDSGLLGSSFLQVPFFLKYFMMGIEYHHIHHMNSKIPGYNLKKYHDDSGLEKGPLFRLSLWEAYQNLWLRVYDPEHREYLTIQEAIKRVKSN
jgi:omega-6 fatty acid desaturase (delta-12 desaturase)